MLDEILGFVGHENFLNGLVETDTDVNKNKDRHE